MDSLLNISAKKKKKHKSANKMIIKKKAKGYIRQVSGC